MNEYLYEQIGFLPDWLHTPVVAIVLMIVGYFISKVAAATLANLATIFSRSKTNETNAFPKRFSRLIFWLSWSCFLYAGFSQFLLISSVFTKWNFRNPNPIALLAIGLLMLILHITSDARAELFAKINKAKKNFGSVKLNEFFITTLLYFGLFLFIVLSGISLNIPKSFGTKVLASILMLFIGLLASKILKEVVFSAISLPRAKTSASKLASYFTASFVFSSFILTIFEIWV